MQRFGELKVLRNINQHVNMGEVVSIIGPSGSGKSTFLRCLNLLEVPDSGKITFEGVEITDKKIDIDKHRQKMGMVFQHFNLFNNKTVLQNIMLAPVYVRTHDKSEKKSKRQIVEEAKQEALELLDRIGLRDKADVYPSTLSGGQKQRVAIARALVSKPAIVLADEPTGNLDSMTSSDVLSLLKVTSTKFHQTLVMITHNSEIAQLADRIIRIEDGKIVQ